jgi:hypothetical protein
MIVGFNKKEIDEEKFRKFNDDLWERCIKLNPVEVKIKKMK